MIKTILEKGGIKTGVIGTLGVIIGDTTYPTNNTKPESYEVQKYLTKKKRKEISKKGFKKRLS